MTLPKPTPPLTQDEWDTLQQKFETHEIPEEQRKRQEKYRTKLEEGLEAAERGDTTGINDILETIKHGDTGAGRSNMLHHQLPKICEEHEELHTDE